MLVGVDTSSGPRARANAEERAIDTQAERYEQAELDRAYEAQEAAHDAAEIWDAPEGWDAAIDAAIDQFRPALEALARRDQEKE